MLSIRMGRSGRRRRISIAACRPLISGMFMSSTTTSGSRLLIELDRFGAAAGLADHLDVHFVLENAPEPLAHERMIVGQNHSNPRHVYATSGRLAVARHPGTRRCTMVPPPAPASHVQLTADQLGALAHADHSHASGRIGCRRLLRDPGAAILDGELQVAVAAGDAHPGVRRSGVPRRIAQRLLDDAIDVDRAVLAHGIERTGRRRGGSGCRSAAGTVRRIPRGRAPGRSRRARPDAATAIGDESDRAPAARCRAPARARIRAACRRARAAAARPSSVPIAVRICPKSSCSSRASER